MSDRNAELVKEIASVEGFRGITLWPEYERTGTKNCLVWCSLGANVVGFQRNDREGPRYGRGFAAVDYVTLTAALEACLAWARGPAPATLAELDETE